MNKSEKYQAVDNHGKNMHKIHKLNFIFRHHVKALSCVWSTVPTNPRHLCECVRREYLSVYKGYANPVIAEKTPTEPPDAVDLI